MGRKLTLKLNDGIGVTDMASIERTPLIPFSKKHKKDYEMIIGDRIGRDGKLAFIYQIADRVNDFYKKFVSVGGKITKDIECKLSEHRY